MGLGWWYEPHDTSNNGKDVGLLNCILLFCSHHNFDCERRTHLFYRVLLYKIEVKVDALSSLIAFQCTAHLSTGTGWSPSQVTVSQCINFNNCESRVSTPLRPVCSDSLKGVIARFLRGMWVSGTLFCRSPRYWGNLVHYHNYNNTWRTRINMKRYGR